MTAMYAWVHATGMVTPVGDCTEQTVTSVRAGISRYAESAVYNKRFEPMTLALLPEDALPPLSDALAEVPGLTSRQIRMLRLAHPALTEALAALPTDQPPPPLFLAGPEALPQRPPAITDDFLDQLILQSKIKLDRKTSQLFPTGRAGGMQALSTGLQALNSGQQDFILIGGVDSYLDLYLLGTLDMEDRVLANGVMDGFCPGEGAAFLLLCSERARENLTEKQSIKVHYPGIAMEAGHRYSKETYTGSGLAGATPIALTPLNGVPVQTVLSSINGESFGAKEWGVAYTRNSSAIDPDFRFEHPADCFGDTGAAAAPILIALAAHGLEGETLPGPCLAWVASEGALRGAVCLSHEST